jgi:hypothetical protein
MAYGQVFGSYETLPPEEVQRVPTRLEAEEAEFLRAAARSHFNLEERRSNYNRQSKTKIIPLQMLGDQSCDIPLLFDFFGTLATVFPGTATVESDFSILKWTKNSSSTRTSDFSLEGKLHARQWNDLQEC